MIREARPADLDALQVLLLRAHERAADHALPVDVSKARYCLAQYIALPGYFAMVSERVRGALFAHLDDAWYGPGMIATDRFFYAEDGSGVALLRRFLPWAQERGASAVCLADSSGIAPDRVRKLYRAVDLVEVGGLFRRDFP